MTLRFRRLTADDLRLLHEWLQREHVRRWWTKHETYDDVVRHYLPAVEGREPTAPYAIESAGRPIGFVQTYRVADYPDYRSLVDVEEGVAGLDLFIAEPELLGRGLGSRVIAQFVDDIVFADPELHACIADPDADNVASLRAFEKAGFRAVRRFDDPDDSDRPHVLMRLDRYGERRSTVHVSSPRS